METQFYVEYEIIDSVTNTKFVTRERYEALSCYKADDMVYERHVTVCNSSPFNQTYMVNVMAWHLNPNFREED